MPRYREKEKAGVDENPVFAQGLHPSAGNDDLPRNLRIVHLSSAHRANDIRIFVKECQSLAKRGFEVLYIVPSQFGGPIDGVVIRPVRVYRNRLQRMFVTPWVILSAALRCKADLYHIHDVELLPQALVLRLFGRRVIRDIHEDMPRDIQTRTYLPRILIGIIAWIVGVLELATAPMFSALVVAVPTFRERFAGWNRRIAVVNNYPLLSELSEETDSQAALTPSPGAVYAGALAPERGAFEMIDAIARVDQRFNARLVLAGEFMPASLRRDAERLSGWERVDYIGYIGRQQLLQVYARARVGLLLFHPCPAHLAAQPTKLYEYMAAGLPVIASDFPLWRDLISRIGCGILVNPQDVDQVAAALDHLLENPELAAEMGRRGREAVRRELNWSIEEESLLRVYRECLPVQIRPFRSSVEVRSRPPA
jgi:glycosyltransferase involved in cell wall biosynthesis